MMLNNLQQKCLKLLQKEQFKNTAEATSDLLRNKNAEAVELRRSLTMVELRKSQKLYQKQKQLQMNMIKKYLKKDMYLQKRDRKLLIN